MSDTGALVMGIVIGLAIARVCARSVRLLRRQTHKPAPPTELPSGRAPAPPTRQRA